jgi:hypothetical protein
MNMIISTQTATTGELRRAIAAEGLRLEDICEFLPLEEPTQRHILAELLRWVMAWRLCPDRAFLERMGFLYPPVDPGIDPDTDWLRFERWMRGEPLEWTYRQTFGALRDPETMTDAELARELELVLERLASRSVALSIPPEVPDRDLYEYLYRELASGSFEVCAQGTQTFLTGCSGDCEHCFQQRWCPAYQEGGAMRLAG